MKRRRFLMASAAGIASVAPAAHAAETDSATATQAPATPAPQPPAAEKHSFAQVIALAEKLAQSDDAPETLAFAGPFAGLNYDQYRGIRFKSSAEVFAGTSSPFTMDLLPPGLMFNTRVRIYTVVDDLATEIPFSAQSFDFDNKYFKPEQTQLPEGAEKHLGWTGFRLRYPLNSPDYRDEFAVFQGASYFRAIARDTLYGLSARGLAISTGDPDGEEFPRFSRFWIYQPKAGANMISLDALLESASLTGAYHMDIYSGEETVFKITCSLFPRQEITKVGIAPLTSMYYFSPARRAMIDDYRNAVHDSEGLGMLTGTKNRLWRVLANPARLQFSSFVDQNPSGYGLIQRQRHFGDYEDAEARYEKRPSAWIQPRENWNKGVITLIEIPVDTEFNDNIITFWHPNDSLKAKQKLDLNYDIIWSKRGPEFAGQAKIIDSRCGRSINHADAFTFVIDYAPYANDRPSLNPDNFAPNLTASRGTILSQSLFLLPESNRLRFCFDYQPENGRIAELQLQLQPKDENIKRQIAETWMYQWLPA